MNQISYDGGLSIEQVRDQIKADKIYKLSSNESPLGPSPKVLAAIQEQAASLNSYPPNNNGRFRSILANFHGRGLTDEHFVTAVSGVEVLELLARTFLTPKDEVIICPPAFGWYVRSVQQQGAKIKHVPLNQPDFTHNIDAILEAITTQTRIIYICTPHNPTGVLVTAAEMERLVANVPDHVIIVADTVYQHFVTADNYPDVFQYVLDGRNVFVIQSFSKAYGMAGLRLGYAIAKPELSAKVRGTKRPFHISSLALAAGTAALGDQAHVQRGIAIVQAGKQYLYEELEKLGVKFWHSHGNFIMLRPPLDAQFVNDQLIQRGIMIRPTKASGLPGHLRVTVGLPEANQAFIAALAEILKS